MVMDASSAISDEVIISLISLRETLPKQPEAQTGRLSSPFPPFPFLAGIVCSGHGMGVMATTEVFPDTNLLPPPKSQSWFFTASPERKVVS